MNTQTVQTLATNRRRYWIQEPIALSLLIGLSLGKLFTVLWPTLPVLATFGMWPLGTAVAMIVVGLASVHLLDKPAWGLMIGGQFLGVLAVSLFFISSIV